MAPLYCSLKALIVFLKALTMPMVRGGNTHWMKKLKDSQM
jgi:hypothetical protein